jgi:NADH:ubiquinone oxidoreductase subunit 4 (subunit M)
MHSMTDVDWTTPLYALTGSMTIGSLLYHALLTSILYSIGLTIYRRRHSRPYADFHGLTCIASLFVPFGFYSG